MNKQELLDQVQAAKDRLDEAGADDGVMGYSQLVMVIAQLADVMRRLIEPQPGQNGEIVEAKLELIKTWKEQDHPKFPPPKFNIGDWAIYTGDDVEENERAYMVTGQSLEFYRHSGRFVWYYDFGDNFNGCIATDDDGDNWQHTEPDPERSPYPPVCECWNCHKIRVDDGLNCVECDATPTAF